MIVEWHGSAHFSVGRLPPLDSDPFAFVGLGQVVMKRVISFHQFRLDFGNRYLLAKQVKDWDFIWIATGRPTL